MGASQFGRYAGAKATPEHFARVPLKVAADEPLTDKLTPPQIVEAPRRRGRARSAGWPPRDFAGRAWFVVTTAPQSERACCLALRQMGYGAYVPMETFWVPFRSGDTPRKREVQRPFFVRYVFVGLRVDEPWWPLHERDATGKNRVGISGVLTSQGRPAPVSVRWLASLAHREREGWFDERKRVILEGREAEMNRPKVEAGERVRILSGALINHEAVAETTAVDAKFKIALPMFGQVVVTEVSIDDVENLTRSRVGPQLRMHGPLI